MRPPGRAAADLRLLRAAVFAAACVLLSAAGHALAGGGFPPMRALTAGGLAVLACAAPMAGRKRSVPGIPVALMAGQVGLHVLYCLSAAPVGAMSRPGAGIVAIAERLRCGGAGSHPTAADAASLVRQAGLTHSDVARLLADAPTHTPHAMAGMAGMSMGLPTSPGALAQLLPSPSMLAAHLAAATLMGLLLWRGEAALWILTARPACAATPRLLARVPGVLCVFAAVAGAVDSAGRQSRASAFPDVGCRWAAPDLRHLVVRRGPPVALTAV